jgi:predicted CoA-binding protein
MPESKKYVNPPVDEIDSFLGENKVIAIVGLSSNPDRASYAVAHYLKCKGYKIIPVNPKENQILEEKACPSLKEIPQKVDIVNIFRSSEFVPPIVKDAIEIGAKVVWMQEGVISHAAACEASENGLGVVMDKCIAKELRRYLNVIKPCSRN